MVKLIIQKANARLNFLYRKQAFLNVHTKKLFLVYCFSVISIMHVRFDTLNYRKFLKAGFKLHKTKH